ncbi:MAG: hypothetical protein AseanaTS_07050 [Candidatus Pelagadaptatus aseana]|uniref:glutamine amidotransferase-related protein n=1 Tax=Candidatus Pelagadaptatus aseana TaxID=3120508 RepID=UPI0039B248B0
MKSVLIIQNDAREGAGILEQILIKEQVSVHHFYGWDLTDDLANIPVASGLVILGGAQGAYEVESYPYLAAEMELVRLYAEQDKPVIGICLGAQIIAEALGGGGQT